MGGTLSRMRKSVALATLVVIGLFGSALIAFAATTPSSGTYGASHVSASASGFCGSINGHSHWRFNAKLLPNGRLKGSAVVQLGADKRTFSGKGLQQIVVTDSTVSLSINGNLRGARNTDLSVYTADIQATDGSPDSVDITVHNDTTTIFHQSCVVGRPGHVLIRGVAANASVSAW
jgi:hypothetical protein